MTKIMVTVTRIMTMVVMVNDDDDDNNDGVDDDDNNNNNFYSIYPRHRRVFQRGPVTSHYITLHNTRLYYIIHYITLYICLTLHYIYVTLYIS